MTQLQTIINLLQSIDARLAAKSRGKAFTVRSALPTPLEDRLLSWIAKGKQNAFYSILVRRASRDGSDAVDRALGSLMASGRIVRIQGKHGWKFAVVVSHTPTEPDASPLVTDSTPV